MNFENFKKHLKKILMHKFYVGKICFIAGLYWRGLTHDLSKFSFIEFVESANNYQGDFSPIDYVKKQQGYCNCWRHHIKNNSHHYEYWIENSNNGIWIYPMPFCDALEMICDRIGAAKAYQGEDYTFKEQYMQWQKDKEHIKLMHPQTKEFAEKVFKVLYNENDISQLKDISMLKMLYHNSGDRKPILFYEVVEDEE